MRMADVTVKIDFTMTEQSRELLRQEVRALMCELVRTNQMEVADFVRSLVRDELRDELRRANA